MPIEQRGVQDWEPIIPFFQHDVQGQGSPDGGKMSRSYLVPWDYPVQRFIQEAIGYPYMGTDEQGNNVMRRHLPEVLAYMLNEDDAGYYYCTNYHFEPLGGGGEEDLTSPNAAVSTQPLRKWEYANVTLEYQTLPYDCLTADEIIDENDFITVYPLSSLPMFGLYRYVTWNDDDRLEYGVSDHAAWRRKEDGVLFENWADAGNKVGIPIPSGSVTLTLWDVHSQAFNSVRARGLEGKTNTHKILEYEPGTLLFNGFKRRRRTSPLGQKLWSVELAFIHKPNGVNYVIDRFGSGYAELQNRHGEKPIKEADLRELFVA